MIDRELDSREGLSLNVSLEHSIEKCDRAGFRNHLTLFLNLTISSAICYICLASCKK